MQFYINGIGSISPQPFSESLSFEFDSPMESNSLRLNCQEPDYKNYIQASLLRRMSRIIKMGVATSTICLKNAGIEKPDAIITATGLGCIEDTEKFTHSILENNETLLTPTPFIQSTHNTVGGQIALLMQCTAYNYTYVNRGSSFEAALQDSTLLLEEKKGTHILVGAIEELTNNSQALLQGLGIYQRTAEHHKGAIAGEGATFFVLSSLKTDTSKAILKASEFHTGTLNEHSFRSKINSFLSRHGYTASSIDFVLTGENGNKDFLYTLLKEEIGLTKPSISFKKYSGEYHTASAFGLSMAVKLCTEEKLKSKMVVLLYNHFEEMNHSFMLIEKC